MNNIKTVNWDCAEARATIINNQSETMMSDVFCDMFPKSFIDPNYVKQNRWMKYTRAMTKYERYCYQFKRILLSCEFSIQQIRCVLTRFRSVIDVFKHPEILLILTVYLESYDPSPIIDAYDYDYQTTMRKIHHLCFKHSLKRIEQKDPILARYPILALDKAMIDEFYAKLPVTLHYPNIYKYLHYVCLRKRQKVTKVSFGMVTGMHYSTMAYCQQRLKKYKKNLFFQSKTE